MNNGLLAALEHEPNRQRLQANPWEFLAEYGITPQTLFMASDHQRLIGLTGHLGITVIDSSHTPTGVDHHGTGIPSIVWE